MRDLGPKTSNQSMVWTHISGLSPQIPLLFPKNTSFSPNGPKKVEIAGRLTKKHPSNPVSASFFAMTTDNHPFTIAALYKFVALSAPHQVREQLLPVCEENGITGTILLAKEGINGTVAGSARGIENLIGWLNQKAEFSGIDVKYSHAEEPPFYRMKVRLKKEIVTMGVEDLDPEKNAGTYVEPADWNALIERDDVIVVDTRNDYEVAIGTFTGAENPNTTSFRELPGWVEDKLKANPDTPVAMFCTGGIRCEKSTALLKSRGYENVYHLKGGILKYLETVPKEDSLWEGECFVFDHRVSVGHGLEVGQYDMCHACRMPIDENDQADSRYEKGVSCPHCFDSSKPEQKARFAERQRQIDLARSRNETHIAADVETAKRMKRERAELHRQMSSGLKK